MKKFISLLLIAICISLNYSSAATIIISANSPCLGQPATLSLITDIPGTEIARVEWDLDNDGFFDNGTGNNVSILFSTADSFEVAVLVTDTAGKAFQNNFPAYVFIKPVPEVIIKTSIICEGLPFSVSVSDTTLHVEWDMDNNGTFELIGNPIKQIFSVAGNADIQIKGIALNGCSAIVTKNISIHPLPTIDYSIIGQCVEMPIEFSSNTSLLTDTPSVFLWEFGDSTQSFQKLSTSHIYTTDGVFNTKLITFTDFGCSDTASTVITIFEKPTVDVAFYSDTLLFPEKSVTLVATTDASNTLLWNTGTNGSSINVIDTGTYTVMVTNTNGCIDKDSIKVEVGLPIVPKDMNTALLTPNDDGINDTFTIPGLEDYGTCKFSLYSAWGDKLYNTSNYTNNWDGTIDGSKVKTGVYYYFIECEKGKKMKGSINVIR
jgi:gliding motility-associated-like protein